MGATAINLPNDILIARRQLGFAHSFLSATSDGRFTLTATSGTITALGAAGGGITLLTQAADNAVASALSNAKIAAFADNKPIYFNARVHFSEAGSNAANVFIGMSSDTATNTVSDNGGGPPASYSGLGFFKTDGGSANWSVELSLAGTQTTVELTANNSLNKTANVAASSSYQDLTIEVIPKTSTKADVIFSIDGTPVYKATDWTYTSIAAMSLMAAVKAGSSTAETLYVQRIDFAQVI